MGTKGRGLVLAWCCGLLMVAGCAKEEVVQKDQPLAPATVTAQAREDAQARKSDATPATKQTLPAEAVTTPAVAESSRQQASTAASQQEQLSAGLERIYFDFDSAGLSSAARQTLAKNAAALKKSSIKVRIEGNCDERGSDEYNLALGEKRARAAMQYLTTMGIAADRLSVISFGKEKPVDAGHDETAWANNRRDDFVTVR